MHVFLIVPQTYITFIHATKITAYLIKTCSATCNPSCLAWCSSRTSLRSLTRSPSWRTITQHARRSPWETYICLLLFDPFSYGQTSPSATNLLISWAAASFRWICCTLWDTRKRTIHVILFQVVVWRTARYITQSLQHIESMHNVIAHTTFDTYQEISPDFQCCAILLLLLLLLRSLIQALGVLHVLLVSTVRKPLVSTTNVTCMLRVKE